MSTRLLRVFSAISFGLLVASFGFTTSACTVGDAGGDGDGDGDGDIDAGIGGDGDAPVVTVEAGATVLAGMNVPLVATVDTHESIVWTQVSGPTATFEQADQVSAYALLATDAAPDDSIVFEVTATNADGETKAQVTYTIAAPVYEDYLAGIVDIAELGTTEGIDFNADGLWVVSINDTAAGAGFVSRFDDTGAFVERLEVPDSPIGANFDKDGLLVVTRRDLGTVETLDTANGTLTPVITAGGPTNYPLPDKDGNIFVSNRANGQVIRWDAANQTQAVFTDAVTGTNPNAIAFGPEVDVLYVGAVDTVYRVPINADGTAGTPSVYVTVTGEVDGLVFDSGRNLWIGSPGARGLYMAPYVADGPTTARMTYNPPVPNRFVSLTYGVGNFGTTTLYWTSLGERSVGRIDVGLPALVPPLSAEVGAGL